MANNVIPTFSTGLNPIWASFNQRSRVPKGALMVLSDAEWSSDYVADDPIPDRLTMSEFGYRPEELNYRDGVLDDTALVTPVRLLNPEGAQILSSICKGLENYALGSDFIISRRFRGADMVSTFIYNMMRDRRFLIRLSRIAGVPLLPHPLRDGSTQINYYQAESGDAEEVGKWHHDGMEYVFTMLMTDPAEYEGGQFGYFVGRRDEFDRKTLSNDRIRIAPLKSVGDTVFARGSQIYHGVSPVTVGSRMVLTLSMFSPAFADCDPNSFAHVAADDGIPHTLPNWMRLKWPTKNPFRDYALRSSSPVINWSDLRPQPASAATLIEEPAE